MKKKKYFENFQKAAPRFELGVKDLQSSALPLGHATRKISFWVFNIKTQKSQTIQFLIIENIKSYSQKNKCTERKTAALGGRDSCGGGTQSPAQVWLHQP